MYLSGTDTVGVSTNGTLRFSISDTIITSTLVVRNGSGLPSVPAYSFTSDTDAGMYLNATGDLRLTAAGSGAGIPAQMAIVDDTTDGTISFFAKGVGTVRALVGVTTKWSVSNTVMTLTVPSNGADGSASAPTYSFTNDTDAGMWLQGIGDLRIGVANSSKFAGTDDGTNGSVFLFARGTGIIRFQYTGSDRLTVGNSAIVAAVPLLGANGSNTAPTYSFSSDSGNGMYLFGTDTLGWATNGTLGMSLNASNILNVVDSITIATDHDVQVMDWMTVAP